MTSRSISRMGVGLALVCSLAGAGLAAVAPGQKAPDFMLPASDGKTYHLADYSGKYVVLEWYNKSCPFIRKHYDSGNMQKLQNTYLKKGVIWFSVASSAIGKEGYMTPAEATQDRVEEKSESTATLLDPKGGVGRLYGAKTSPHMFVIDPKGQVIYAGAIDDHNSADQADIPDSKNYVVAALEESMAGKSVTVPSTPPYGCAVKY